MGDTTFLTLGTYVCSPCKTGPRHGRAEGAGKDLDTPPLPPELCHNCVAAPQEW